MFASSRSSSLFRESMVVTSAYLISFFVTFQGVLRVQNAFFPEFPSHASLLFLPHGVRVLTAWLLGWRSVIALTPGVALSFYALVGFNAFTPSRLFAILVAVTIPALTFHALRRIGWDLFPKHDQTPCWPCVVAAGVIVSVLTACLTNLAFGSGWHDVIAYLIGDFFGLFFLMAILMFVFRMLRKSKADQIASE